MVRHLRLIVAVGTLVFLGATPGCVFQADQPADDVAGVSDAITSGATYLIKAVHSGKCVDVSGVSQADGANVQQWTCNGGANQQWKVRAVGGGLWEIVSVNSGKCLEVANASGANGGNVQQSACQGAAHQRWSVSSVGGSAASGPFQIKSAASGKCLDVAGVSRADGANVQQWTCGSGGNQRFTLTATAGAGGGSDAGAGGSGGSGSGGSGGGGSSGGGGTCDAPGLVWKTGNKTNYTSYPAPGSEECIQFSGCEFEGLFAACNDKKPKSWVMSHNIVAAFPNFTSLRLHDVCLRSGSKTIVATVLDTCGDADCNGCCTQNRGNADALIDIESFTNARWGVPDGRIEWADLGPTTGGGCQ